MKGEIKQLDKRVGSNGQVSNPRIIIDASYIRGMKKDGVPLRTMCEQGGRIVLIDTLFYELKTTCDRNQWFAAMRKLVEYRDSIEVWQHVSTMVRIELEENHPYGDPVCDEMTKRLRKMLKENPDFQPENSESFIKRERDIRESPESLEFLRRVAASAPLSESGIKIKGRALNDDETMQDCYHFINDPDHIRLALRDVIQDPDKVDHTWVLWHLAKTILTVCCDEELHNKFVGISNKKLANIKHDLNYLVSLAFADALATRETRGEMLYYRQWMFGKYAKLLIRSYENEQITRSLREIRQMYKIVILVHEQLDGYRCALSPWSRAPLKVQDSETLPSSLFVSRSTKRSFELFHGSTWEHVAELLTGYSTAELQNFGGIVFVDTSTLETLFEPSAQYA